MREGIATRTLDIPNKTVKVVVMPEMSLICPFCGHRHPIRCYRGFQMGFDCDGAGKVGRYIFQKEVNV